MRILRWFGCLLACTTAHGQTSQPAGSQPAGPRPQSPPTSQPTQFAAMLERIRAARKLPALAAAVLEGPAVRELAVVGRRSLSAKAPALAEDRFHLGSCGKAMTATMLARLVEVGTLRWDMTIAEGLPDIAARVHADFAPVTLAQLLAHRGGLPEDRAPDALLWQARALTGPLIDQRREIARLALAVAPAHAPGSQMAYSNRGYVIAAAIAERQTGKAYEDLMRELLFDPLGITTAGFGPPGAADKLDQPRGHVEGLLGLSQVSPGPLADNPLSHAPAGCVHMSLADWARFVALHLEARNGRPRLMKAAAFEALHKAAPGADYAGGWIIADSPRRGPVLAHTGSNGMWLADVLILPRQNKALLIVTNCATDAAMEALEDLHKELIR